MYLYCDPLCLVHLVWFVILDSIGELMHWLLFRYLWMFLCLWISRKNRSENGFVTLMAWCNRKTITKSPKKLQNGMMRVTNSQEKLWHRLWTCPSEIYLYWSCLFMALLDEISGFLLNLFIFCYLSSEIISLLCMSILTYGNLKLFL